MGMNMGNVVRGHLADGDLVPLLPDRPLDVPLCWQWPRSAGAGLGPVTMVGAGRRPKRPDPAVGIRLLTGESMGRVGAVPA